MIEAYEEGYNEPFKWRYNFAAKKFNEAEFYFLNQMGTDSCFNGGLFLLYSMIIIQKQFHELERYLKSISKP